MQIHHRATTGMRLPPQITAENTACVCVFPAIVMSEPTKLWPSIDLLPCKLIVLHHVIPQKR